MRILCDISLYQPVFSQRTLENEIDNSNRELRKLNIDILYKAKVSISFVE